MAAPAFQAAGAVVKAAAGVTPSWPTHATDDVALLFVETANQAATLTTANGFVEITNSPQGTGTAGAATATRLTVFWCRATSAAMSAPVIADSGDHQIAVIVTFRGCIATGNPWDVTAGGTAASGTSFSIPTATTTVDECLVVLALTNNGASDTTEVVAVPSNTALTAVTKRVDSQPVLPDRGSTMLRVGPYGGLMDLVGIGPGGDTGKPYYRLAGINPHDSLATFEAQIAVADDLDITLMVNTAGTPTKYGAFTATGFDIDAYTAKLDILAALPYFATAVASGRCILYIGDEPQHSKWGIGINGATNTWTPTLVNDCARLHKTRWPTGYTVIRQDCHRLRVGWGGNAAPPSYDALDYGVMQYEGPNARAGETFMEAYAADKADGDVINVGVVPSLNLWAGGIHALNDGVAACWDYLNNGVSSGVIAGAVQNSTSPYGRGQQVACATWNATPAPKPSLASSPAWIRRCTDALEADPDYADIPWFFLWTYMRDSLSDNVWAGPLQIRSDYVAALDYSVATGLARTTFSGLRTRKVYP